MQVLKSKIFKNGMTKKVKHIMGNTFEIQYSNCSKEQVQKEILKLEKIFECVIFKGSKVLYCNMFTFETYYNVLCYNPKQKYIKKISEV